MARVALVTGAARGIGAATVAALAADGWRVVAADRCADDPALPYALGTRAELDRVVAAAADNAVAVEADVRDPEALAAAVRLAEERWGGLDAAVAAAGVIAGGAPAWQVPAGQEQAVLDVDLGGVLNLARVAVPAMLRRPEPRRGRFLAVASAAATRGLPMLAAYCAAKAGVAGFVRALAAELGGTGVTANAVSPGSTETAMLDESARLYGLPAAGAFAAQVDVEHRPLLPGRDLPAGNPAGDDPRGRDRRVQTAPALLGQPHRGGQRLRVPDVRRDRDRVTGGRRDHLVQLGPRPQRIRQRRVVGAPVGRDHPPAARGQRRHRGRADAPRRARDERDANGLGHLIVLPASTVNSRPVTYRASSEARNSTALLMSRASTVCTGSAFM